MECWVKLLAHLPHRLKAKTHKASLELLGDGQEARWEFATCLRRQVCLGALNGVEGRQQGLNGLFDPSYLRSRYLSFAAF